MAKQPDLLSACSWWYSIGIGSVSNGTTATYCLITATNVTTTRDCDCRIGSPTVGCMKNLKIGKIIKRAALQASKTSQMNQSIREQHCLVEIQVDIDLL